MPNLISFFKFTFFPVWVGMMLMASWLGYQSGFKSSHLVAFVVLLTLAVVSVLERWIPFEKSWNQSKDDVATDFFSFGVAALILDPLMKIGLTVVSLWWLQKFQSNGAFLLHSSLWVQTISAILIADFGKYWVHRWFHNFEILWPFHAMHHSTERLYSLNNSRIHPLNYILNVIVSTGVLALLGVSEIAILIYSVLSLTVSFFQHANLDLEMGFLNYVLSTNEVHRWHHSEDLIEGNKNFGSTFIFWDLLFGTFYLPSKRGSPERLGVHSPKLFPKNGYWAQFIWPMKCLCRC